MIFKHTIDCSTLRESVYFCCYLDVVLLVFSLPPVLQQHRRRFQRLIRLELLRVYNTHARALNFKPHSELFFLKYIYILPSFKSIYFFKNYITSYPTNRNPPFCDVCEFITLKQLAEGTQVRVHDS